MTLVLVFRHLCSELRSDKLERQDNQALLLWRQLNPPASLFPFHWYSCYTMHRGWRLLQTVARLGEHELLDIKRDHPMKITTSAQSKQAMKRINITGSLMYVIWYSPFLQETRSTMLFFLHLLLAESITSTHGMSSSTMTYDHHLHVDTTAIASIYSTKGKLHEVWHAGRINDNYMAPAIMPYHDM